MEEHSTDKILGAARRLLQELGPDGLTYRAIATRTGMSVGTVAYYFGSRSNLLEAALEPHHDRVVQILRPLFSPERLTPAQAGDVVEALTRYGFENQPDIRLRTAAWMKEWKLPPVRLGLVTSTLKRAVKLPWKAQWDEPERRVIIQALVYAAQRFAAMDDGDLATLLGVESAEEARETVVRTLRRLSESFVAG